MAVADATRQRRAWEEQQRVFRRRRLVGLGLAILLVVVGVRACAGVVGGDDQVADRAAVPELPRGGRQILPHYRLVAYYGAPQADELGVLGTTSPQVAAQKLVRAARQFDRPGRPAMPAFELIVTLAQAAPGQDGKHRLRQTDKVITDYLRAVRAVRGLMILDVQPGQADFVEEVHALQPYLLQPDVGLALDPEWSVPAGTVPGSVIGSTDAATVNEVVDYLARIVRARNLPEKVLIVHQFTEKMVTDRDLIRAQPGVKVVSNMDGFGTPPLKEGIYDQLSNKRPPRRGAPRLGEQPFNGFKLFFREDTGLMSPSDVLALDPAPDVVVYE